MGFLIWIKTRCHAKIPALHLQLTFGMWNEDCIPCSNVDMCHVNIALLFIQKIPSSHQPNHSLSHWHWERTMLSFIKIRSELLNEHTNGLSDPTLNDPIGYFLLIHSGSHLFSPHLLSPPRKSTTTMLPALYFWLTVVIESPLDTNTSTSFMPSG